MQCPVCGNAASERAKFCKTCGSNLTQQASPPQRPAPDRPELPLNSPSPGPPEAPFSHLSPGGPTAPFSHPSPGQPGPANASASQTVFQAAGQAFKNMPLPENIYVIAACLAVLLAVFAPWYQLSDLAAVGASFLGIESSPNLFGEVGILFRLMSLSGDAGSVIAMAFVVFLTATMLASVVVLVLFVRSALFTHSEQTLRLALIGFCGLAGVALVHNIAAIATSTEQFQSLTLSIGGPSALAWLLLLLALAAGGYLVYTTLQHKPLFNEGPVTP